MEEETNDQIITRRRRFGYLLLWCICVVFMAGSFFIFDEHYEQALAVLLVACLGLAWNLVQWRWIDRFMRRSYVASLEEFVWNRAVQQQQELYRAQQMNDMRNEFIRVVSHQLRTPLSAIRWNLDEFLDQTHATLSRPEKERLNDVRAAAHNITATVQKLLTILDIQEGRLAIHMTPVDPVTLVRAAYASWRPLMEWKGITFTLEVPKRYYGDCLMDKEKIREAINILLENAHDYTHRGGSVVLSLSVTAKTVRVSVRDTGIGISSKDKAALYRPFFRGASAVHEKPSGSGVGLAICQRYIRSHSGSVEVKSRPGQGSVFTLQWPVHPPIS